MDPTTFVLFGATGDLAKRKIYPALYQLFAAQKLPQSFTLIGLGRRELSDESFRANVEQSLRNFSRCEINNSSLVKAFLKAFRYSVLDIGRKEDYLKLLQMIEQREAEFQSSQNRLFYLSVAPEFYETVAANIQESGLGCVNGWKRLVVEKPFGRDLQSARDLNSKLSKAFAEREIFRIDHYLGKPIVQKLEFLKQNPVLKALLTKHYIANVQITASETVGVEERAGYYDHIGAVRDMFQNHMLQLLMMLASHLPNHSSSEMVSFKKKKVMEALETLQKQDVSDNVVRGQYTAGIIQGKPVTGYTSEQGIEHTSKNDTFIAARLRIDDFFWRGVPFYIRTGKRMKEKSTRIVIEFKEPLTQPSSQNDEREAPNLLVFEIGPTEGITLQLNTRSNQDKGKIKPVHLNFYESRNDAPEAYENLIYDALCGDPTFFAQWDEVELSWKWVQPILEAFEENLVPLYLYEAGTYGPAEAESLLAEDGYHWWFDVKSGPDSETKEGEQYAYHANY